MDAIEKHEVRQAACKRACAKWSTMASLWTDGEILKDADSHCAQPKAAVNSHTYRSWCYCAETPGHLRVRLNEWFDAI